MATFWLCCVSAWAQFDTAQISGVVRDQSGAVIPGAGLTLTNEGTGLQRQAITNDGGVYVFPNTPVGVYTVAAELPSFRTYRQTGIQLSSGVNIRIDIELQVGDAGQTVEVSANPVAVVTDTAVIARTVLAERIAEIPLSGRRVTQVAVLSAGVRGANLGDFGGAQTNSFATGVTSINGGRDDEFITTIDGAPSIRIRQVGGFQMGSQNADTVSEVQVLTTNYQAEYGRSSAGQIRVVTKSGTREFHGNLFWQGQNSALNANTWTRNRSPLSRENAAPPHHVFNAFGFTLGGPIFIPGKFNTNRDRLFFFLGEEWTRNRADNTRTGIVPSLAMRTGDFRELSTAIIDPQTGRPFSGNIIPPERFSRNGKALLDAYPKPVPGFREGANNWITTLREWNNLRKDSIKIDAVFSDRHRLAFRHTWNDNIWNNFFGIPLDTYAQVWQYPGRTLSTTLTSTFSPRFLNEFTFSFGSTFPARFYGQRNCDAKCPSFAASNILYPLRSQTGLNYPYLFPGTKLDPEKLPDVALQGYSSMGQGPYPGEWNDFALFWSDHMTLITGNHTLKWGATIERSGMNDQIQLSFAFAPQTANQNGAFRFFNSTRPDSTGHSVANALLGLFDDYTEFGIKPNTRYLAMAYDFFAQDSWKATPNLTLELGLRYSLWEPWGAEDNVIAMFSPRHYDPGRAAVLDPATAVVTRGDRFNGIVVPGDGPTPGAIAIFPQLRGLERLYSGIPRGFYETHKNAFQPRVGLAYALNRRTTIRSGVGMFLNRIQTNTTAAWGFNPPLSEMQTVINGSVDSPGGGAGRQFPLIVPHQDFVSKIPTSWAWNASVDRELPGAILAQISYVGRRAYNMERSRNINQILVPGTIQANRGVNPDALRPYQGFGPIRAFEHTATSRYNSLQLQIQRRAGAFSFTTAYTLSRNRDNAGSRTDQPPNSYDMSGYYGISDLDRTHVLTNMVTYQVPNLTGAPGAVRWILGGWGISSVFQTESGAPFDIVTTEDIAGIGPGSGSQFFEMNPSIDPKAARTEFDGTQAVWFDRSAFSRPATGTFATSQRPNPLRQPGFWDWHLSVRKSFRVSEDQRFDLRWEAYNWLNHPRLAAAQTNPNIAASFGTITSKTANRTMSVGLQYHF
jgi:hypothetical protein